MGSESASKIFLVASNLLILREAGLICLSSLTGAPSESLRKVVAWVSRMGSPEAQPLSTAWEPDWSVFPLEILASDMSRKPLLGPVIEVTAGGGRWV